MRTIQFIGILIVAIFLTSCQQIDREPYQSFYSEEQNTRLDLSRATDVTIEIWTPEDIVFHTLERFKHYYQDINFEVTVFDQIDLVDRYYQSLLTNKQPDIMIIPAKDAGAFSGIDDLEVLNQDPYYDAEFFDHRPDMLLNQYLNDEGEMYGFPIHFFPYVTFYRHDILEEHGFPSAPDELAEYISDVDHYLELVTAMNEEGLYTYQSTQSMLEWGLNSSYPFDENHRYIYQDPPFSDLLTAMIEIDEQEWDTQQSIWEDDGYQSLEEDRLVMFQAPSFMDHMLYDWFPEQAGKWRVTNLPFDMNGVNKDAALIATIPSNSQEKRIAWELIQMLANNLYNIHVHPQSHPMFDQTNLNQFYIDLFEKPTIGKPSMLDQTAELLWDNNIYKINQGQKIDEIFFEQTHNQLLDQIRNNQRVLTDD